MAERLLEPGALRSHAMEEGASTPSSKLPRSDASDDDDYSDAFDDASPKAPSPVARPSPVHSAERSPARSGGAGVAEAPLSPRTRSRRAARTLCLRCVGLLLLVALVCAAWALTELLRLRGCRRVPARCFKLELVEVGGLCSSALQYEVRARVHNPLSLSVQLGALEVDVRRAIGGDPLASTRVQLESSSNGIDREVEVSPGPSTLLVGPAGLNFGPVDALARELSLLANGSAVGLVVEAQLSLGLLGMRTQPRVAMHVECERGSCSSHGVGAARDSAALRFSISSLTLGNDALRSERDRGTPDGGPPAQMLAQDGLAVALEGVLHFGAQDVQGSASLVPSDDEGAAESVVDAADILVHVPTLEAAVYWEQARGARARLRPPQLLPGGAEGGEAAGGGAGGSEPAGGGAGADADADADADAAGGADDARAPLPPSPPPASRGPPPEGTPLLALRFPEQTLSVRIGGGHMPVRASAWVPVLPDAAASDAQRERAALAATTLLAGEIDSALASGGALRLGGAGALRAAESAIARAAGEKRSEADGAGAAGARAGAHASRRRRASATPPPPPSPAPAPAPAPAPPPPSGSSSSCFGQQLLDSLRPITLVDSVAGARKRASRVHLVGGSAVIDLSTLAVHHRVRRVRAALIGAHAPSVRTAPARLDVAVDLWLSALPSAFIVRGALPAFGSEVRLAGVRVASVRAWHAAWPATPTEPLPLRMSVELGDLSALAARVAYALDGGTRGSRLGDGGGFELSLSGLPGKQTDFLTHALSGVRVVLWRLGAGVGADAAAAEARAARLRADDALYRAARWWEPSFRAGSWHLLQTTPAGALFRVAVPAAALPARMELAVERPRLSVTLSGAREVVALSPTAGRLALPLRALDAELNLTLAIGAALNDAVSAVVGGQSLGLAFELEFDAPGGGVQRLVLPMTLPALRLPGIGGADGDGQPDGDAPAAVAADGAVGGGVRARIGGGEDGTWRVLAGKPHITWGPMMSTLLFWEQGVSFAMQLPLHNPLNFGVEVTDVQLSATFNDPDGASTFGPDPAVPLVDEVQLPKLGFRLEPNQTAYSPKIEVGLHKREVETLTRAMNEILGHHRLCADLKGSVRLQLRHGANQPFVLRQPFTSPHVPLYGDDPHACDFMLRQCAENFTAVLGWRAGGRPLGAGARTPAWARYVRGGRTVRLRVSVLNATGVPPADQNGALSDPYVELSVGCGGRQCSACPHCLSTSIVDNADAPVWDEQLEFGTLSAEHAISVKLFDRDSMFFDHLLLSRQLASPWPPSGALVEVRAIPTFGGEPTRLYARLQYDDTAPPTPDDGSHVLHGGTANSVETHIARELVRVGEGFEAVFSVCALEGDAAAVLKSDGLDRRPHKLGDTPDRPVEPAELPTDGSWLAMHRPAPAFALLVLGAGVRSAEGMLGVPCGNRACPGVAGVNHSLAVTFDGDTVRLYVDGRPTYQRAGRALAKLGDGRTHSVRVVADAARAQLLVHVDDEPQPALHSELLPEHLAALNASGGWAHVGFTAGTGYAEARPLVLHRFAVAVARAAARASVVHPAPSEGSVGHLGRECEFSLEPRTDCGLPTAVVPGWSVYVQAMSSALEGSIARGPVMPTSAADAEDGAATGSGGSLSTMASRLRLRFVPEFEGIHRVLVHEPSTGKTWSVGEVLVLA